MHKDVTEQSSPSRYGYSHGLCDGDAEGGVAAADGNVYPNFRNLTAEVPPHALPGNELHANHKRALMRRLAMQVRTERQRAEIMSIRSAKEKTFVALTCFGQGGTVTAFADRIGLTQDACSRALKALIDEGRVVRLSRGCYACSDDMS